MATYVVTGRTAQGAPQVSVNIAAIDQEEEVVAELDIVAALKAFLLTVPGIGQATALKHEQITTSV